MHLRVKRTTGLQEAIDRVADPARRGEIAESVVDVATRVAADVASRSAEFGTHVGDKASEVAQAVSEEGHTLMEHRARAKAAAHKDANAPSKSERKKRTRHRVRNSAILAAAGAVAAYFLDPENGSARRAAARRRTSTSAQIVGDNLDRAARVAHHTAEATAITPEQTQGTATAAATPLT